MAFPDLHRGLMTDEQERSEPNRIARREALLWLLGASTGIGALSAIPAAQLPPPPNVRIVRTGTPAADSAIARRIYPRTLVNPTTLATLRSQLAADTAFRTRWQTAISQFETGPRTKWTENPVTDIYALAFAAFLACVRGTGDQGLTWGATRQAYIDKVLASMYSDAVNK